MRSDLIDKGRLRQRQDMYLVNHYMGIHVTIVSVALGVAGVAAASLLATKNVGVHLHLLLGLLWLASLLATVTAFSGTTAGSFALPAQVPAIWDLLLPLLMAVAEFLLFAVLIPQVVGPIPDATNIALWFFSMGAFGALAVAAVARARFVFGQQDYAEELKEGIAWYRGRLSLDIAGAGITTAVAAISGTLSSIFASRAVPIAYGGGAVITALLVAAIIAHGRYASHWRSILFQPPLGAGWAAVSGASVAAGSAEAGGGAKDVLR
jgi:hypothetical protein